MDISAERYRSIFGHTGPRVGSLEKSTAPVRHGPPPPSVALGVLPEQVEEGNKRLAAMGLPIRYDSEGNVPRRGISRREWLRSIKALGYHDKDEIRG